MSTINADNEQNVFLVTAGINMYVPTTRCHILEHRHRNPPVLRAHVTISAVLLLREYS